jgi:hypothetical protein
MYVSKWNVDHLCDTNLAESPCKAESKTSGVLSVPCGTILDISSTYFSSGDLSSSESKSSFWKRKKVTVFEHLVYYSHCYIVI